jgi:hypothetical protein
MIIGEAAVSEYSGRDKAAVVTNKVLTTATATITTSAAHGLFAGEKVKLVGVDSQLNGTTWTIATAPTDTTFTITPGGTPFTAVSSVAVSDGIVSNVVPQTSTGITRYLRLETRATAL